jgi:hypothetical protein
MEAYLLSRAGVYRRGDPCLARYTPGDPLPIFDFGFAICDLLYGPSRLFNHQSQITNRQSYSTVSALHSNASEAVPLMLMASIEPTLDAGWMGMESTLGATQPPGPAAPWPKAKLLVRVAPKVLWPEPAVCLAA